jgi:hypothetical protein
MDLEKFLAVSLLIQFGVAVWVTSGARQNNPIPGNIYLFFLAVGFLTFTIGLLNAIVLKVSWVAAGLSGLVGAYAMSKKPPKLFEFLLKTYSLAFIAALAVVAVALWVTAKQPKEQATESFRSLSILCVVLNDLGTLAFAAVMPDRNALLRFFAAFAVPGLGHALMGKPKKGAFFFISIVAIYLTGLMLTSFRMVGREDNPFYWYGQFFSGFTTAVGMLLPPGKAHLPEGWSYTHFDPGLLYVCAAGLLNYVVALNVFEFKTPPPPEPPKEEAKP